MEDDKHFFVFKRLVNSTAKAIVINGCAGSRKTDTAVKYALHCMQQGKCVMLLTKVTSVTHETTTRLHDYGNVVFHKSGNHYFSTKVEVANMDAMIHYQLYKRGIDVSGFRGGSHTWKCTELHRLLMEDNIDKRVYTKDNQIVNVLIVDEFQDFHESTYNLIFDIVKQNEGMQLLVLGDILQTVFQLSTIHPLNAVRSCFIEEHDSIIVNTCYRCPQGHINFVNALHEKHLLQYGLLPLQSANDDISNVPILFAHQGITKNLGANSVAVSITNCVSSLLTIDQTIHPRDIAIIMKGANHNKVFAQLEQMLNNLYEQKGYDDQIGCRVFETKGDLTHITIDWPSAANKTVMLSVHGDKGKGHKVVFFIGMTEKSVPRSQNLFKETELIDQSLSYVALTRSTKYLFVGFTWICPSRYLLEAWDTISAKKLAVFAWQPSTYKSDAHHVLCNALQSLQPICDMENTHLYKKEPIFCPERMICDVTEIVMNAYEHHFDILPEWPNLCTQNVKLFGKAYSVPRCIKDSEVKRCIYGVMTELMFQREYARLHGNFKSFKDQFRQFFVNPDNVLYTDDEEILCFAYDLELNYKHFADIHIELEIAKCYQDVKMTEKIKNLIDSLYISPKYILPLSLYVPAFRKSLKIFIDEAIDLIEITPNVLWNMAVGKCMIQSRIRKPNTSLLLDFFNEPLHGVIENVQALIKYINHSTSSAITFNNKRQLLIDEDDKQKLKVMGFDEKVFKVTMGITGIDDFASKDCIFEIKSPVTKTELCTKWVQQTFLYACLGDPYNKKITFNRFSIIDLTKGVTYNFKFNQFIPRSDVLIKCLTWMKLDEEQITRCMAKLNID
jgi:hypothetical protein